MEEKKDISLSTKIILVGMSFVPVVFSGFLTYFNRIDACCVFAIAELIEQEQKSK